jgi:uncharacterized protein
MNCSQSLMAMNKINPKMKTKLYLFLMCATLASCENATKLMRNSRPTKEIPGFVMNEVPEHVGLVNDYENIYTESEEAYLDSLVLEIEKESSIEIAIITLDDKMTTTKDFDSLTLVIAKTWGVGKPKKNNGILIGISSVLRKIRIQNGLGIEKIVSNEATKAIIDEKMIPLFKTNQYFEGTRMGIKEMYAKLKE